MSAKEKAVEALWSVVLGTSTNAQMHDARTFVDAILAAVGEHFGMLPKGAAGSEAMGTDWYATAARLGAELTERSTSLRIAEHDLYAANKRIAELEQMARSQSAGCRLGDYTGRTCEVGTHSCVVEHGRPNASPEPDATEGDWADEMAEEWWTPSDNGGTGETLAEAFRRIERRGQVKGLRWAKRVGFTMVSVVTLDNEADTIEREGKVTK